jgi:hypothetical protein
MKKLLMLSWYCSINLKIVSKSLKSLKIKNSLIKTILHKFQLNNNNCLTQIDSLNA